MRTIFTIVSGAAIACLAVSGCASGPPSVAKADLQNDITDRLVKAGEKPESVVCADDLVGIVDKSTTCDVVLSEHNSIEPIVRVTKVEDRAITYEMTPALSKEQLQKAVTGLLPTTASGQKVDSVSCESGLKGIEGAKAHCDVEGGGITRRRTIQVDKVEGMLMNFDVVPMLAKSDAERVLLDDRERRGGRRPDSATCSGDLEGQPGNTVTCTVFTGPDTQDFLLTVTSVSGDKIDYKYEPIG